MSIAVDIAKIIPKGLALTEAERAGVVEIAYLAVAADHSVHPEEEAALRSFAGALGHAKAAVDALLGGGVAGGDREAADARLRVVAAGLTNAVARQLAYKAAYALSLADMAAQDEEFEFDLELIDALGLTQETVDDLVAEVIAVLQPAE